MSKFALAVISLSSALLAACQPEPASPPSKRIALVQAASPASDAATLTYSGEVRPRYETDLAFRVSGKIAARLVDVGSEIHAGQPLARLDPADLQLAATAARAQLASAESDYTTAAAERERYAGLLARKFVSQAAFDARENTLNAARSKLEQARAQAEINGNQAAYGVLSSNHPAIVSAVLAEAGQVVNAGQSVLRIARAEEKEIALAVPEKRLAEFRATHAFRIHLWADPNISARGVLRELAPIADPATRSYAARIRLLDPAPEIRFGMTARVTLADAHDPEIVVPLAAVLDLGQGPLVRTVSNGVINSRPVKVGRFGEEGASIVSGINPGELVVIAGANRLNDGDAVEARLVTPPARQR